MGIGRASVNRQSQIGIETTSGTTVAANRSLPTLKFMLENQTETKQYRAQGYKYNTKSRTHKQWGKATFEGPLTFSEIIYVLVTFFGLPTITTPAGATNARQHLFVPNAQGADNFKTLTIEDGDPTAARIMSNAAGTDCEIAFAQDDVTVKGEMLGRLPTSGVLSSNPTQVAQKPVSAREIDVYISENLSQLFNSGNKITDAMKENFKLGKKAGAKWVHNTDYASFKDLVELVPDLTFDFSSEANAQARSLYDELGLNHTKYVGVRATSSETIESGQPFLFELVLACTLSGEKDEDIDGVWAYNFTCAPQYDATLGSAFKIRVVNDIATL